MRSISSLIRSAHARYAQRVHVTPATAEAADEGHTDDALTKGERTRQRLLELAIDRFGDRGYRATSVSEIARAAGLTQAAVYAYFANKEALFDAAVDAEADEVIENARSGADGADVRQLVPMLLLGLLAEIERHPLLQRVVSGQEPDALRRLVAVPALDRLVATITDAVAAGQEAGHVRSDLDPEVFAGGAEAILLSLLMSMTQVGTSTVPRRQVGVLAMFDAALRPPQK
jgi:AcrR family transcriptional regulator